MFSKDERANVMQTAWQQAQRDRSEWLLSIQQDLAETFGISIEVEDPVLSRFEASLTPKDRRFIRLLCGEV